jgi:CheY-like chemotaxis protein
MTRHIPVQIISLEEERQHGLAHGAFAYLVKPVTSDSIDAALERIKRFAAPHTKRLLVVEDNEVERGSIVELLGHDDLEITAVGTGSEAVTALLGEAFDCCVLDLRLPDMSGFELLDRIQTEPSLTQLPVVVFTGKDLSTEEEKRLRAVAKSIVLKDVQSPERLFDETALFLHRVIGALPESKRQLLERLHGSDEALAGKKVLVVDDDVRNIFALSSVLERRGMQVLTASTGSEATKLLETTPEVAIVLMDIMMPEMDGYQTMGVIRENPDYRRLPIIALTAKAMKGDREKCIGAGASEYMSKPVDVDQLVSMMRVWLRRI